MNERDLQSAVLTMEDMSVGLAADLSWSVTDTEIDDFAKLSGDRNPLHMSDAFAQERGFPGRVAHGLLLGAKVSAFVGMLIPGRNCVLLEVQLTWPNPVHAGDEVNVHGEIAEMWTEQRVVRVKIKATKSGNPKPLVVARGWALCQIRS